MEGGGVYAARQQGGDPRFGEVTCSLYAVDGEIKRPDFVPPLIKKKEPISIFLRFKSLQSLTERRNSRICVFSDKTCCENNNNNPTFSAYKWILKPGNVADNPPFLDGEGGGVRDYHHPGEKKMKIPLTDTHRDV